MEVQNIPEILQALEPMKERLVREFIAQQCFNITLCAFTITVLALAVDWWFKHVLTQRTAIFDKYDKELISIMFFITVSMFFLCAVILGLQAIGNLFAPNYSMLKNML